MREQSRPLRIGCVKYLNARPLITGLPGPVAFDHPAALCAKLARNELDVALVSSFEFLRNPIYRIVDGISISSDGPVYSVVVAHSREITDIEQIEIDPASETSVNLVRCLVAELGLQARLVSKPPTPACARLLIGDQAIRFREGSTEFHFWDLGEAWKNLVDLPFVYALWLVRPEVVDPKPIADRLRVLRDHNMCHLDELVSRETEFDSAFCFRYFQEHLRFSFGEREKQGLQSFADLYAKHGLPAKRALVFDLV